MGGRNTQGKTSHTVDDPRTGKLSPRVVRYYITPQLACEGHLTHSKFLQDFQKQGDFYGFLTDFLEKRKIFGVKCPSLTCHWRAKLIVLGIATSSVELYGFFQRRSTQQWQLVITTTEASSHPCFHQLWQGSLHSYSILYTIELCGRMTKRYMARCINILLKLRWHGRYLYYCCPLATWLRPFSPIMIFTTLSESVLLNCSLSFIYFEQISTFSFSVSNFNRSISRQ